MSRIINLIKHYGLKDFCFKSYEKLTAPEKKYSACAEKYFPTEQELFEQRSMKFEKTPLLSIIVPTYETNTLYLEQMLDSVTRQTYCNWQLCIADGSKSDAVEKYVAAYIKEWKNKLPATQGIITYQHLKVNGGIAVNTNAGIEMAEGEYICFLDHDDVLTPNALFEMVHALNENPHAELFYSDEDKAAEDLSAYIEPHFKTDYNSQLLLAYNYFCHFVMVSATLVKKVGTLRSEYDGAQDYDFVLRCSELAKEVCHVPKMLYHWRINPNSTAADSSTKGYAFDGGAKAVAAHLERIGVTHATVEKRVDPGSYRLIYHIPDVEKEVTVLKSDASKEELEAVTTRYIALVDNDLRIQSDGWKEQLCGMLAMPHTGLVAGKIISKGKIKEFGLTFDENGKAKLMFEGLSIRYRGYQKRAVLQQNVSAASLRFVVLEKATYEEVGGFDFSLSALEKAVDFCERLRAKGYLIAINPDVIAKESKY